MKKYKLIIIWRGSDLEVAFSSKRPMITHTPQSSTYEVVGHQFHTNNWFSITYENGEVEYFNRDAIFSIKTPKAA